MNGYNKRFTLMDLFSNDELKDILPQIKISGSSNFGEETLRTKISTATNLVYTTAVRSARPFYTKFTPTKMGDIITLSGETNTLDMAFESVYNNLLGIKNILTITANNMDMIRDALKETIKNGKSPNLYLKVGSILEIKNMNKKQLGSLLDDVMRNIFYSSNFEKTQAKYQVDKIKIGNSNDYERRRNLWLKSVGEE